jgi:hypothetical protein
MAHVVWIDWGQGEWQLVSEGELTTPGGRQPAAFTMVLVDAPQGGGFVQYQTRSGRITRDPASGSVAPLQMSYRQRPYLRIQSSEIRFCTGG